MISQYNIVSDYHQLSSEVAGIVATQINEHPLSKLCLPTGSTPLGMYKDLVMLELDWRMVITFNLDVYLMNTDHPESYQSYMRKNLFDSINIFPINCHFPFHPTDAFEDKIAGSMGIDLCILGIGTNGHIAFNEPGSSFLSRTRAVNLDEQTIQDNSRFFGSVDDTPKQAITMGLGTIMESKKIVLMANGKYKREILDEAMYGDVTEEIPASILQKHDNVIIFYCD